MMDKGQKKPPKPLKILVNLFSKSKRAKSAQGKANCQSVDNLLHQQPWSPPIIRTNASMNDSMSHILTLGDTLSTANDLCSGYQELYTEFEALHLSRQDNPFLKKASASHDDLLVEGSESLRNTARFGGSTSTSLMMSPEHPMTTSTMSFSSPTRSCDPLALGEVHARLIRSPPPIHWPDRGIPLSPRSHCGTGGAFSPDSMEGNELEYQNYYTRSQSEEHILRSRENLLLKQLDGLSPTRGITPDLLMTTSLHSGASTLAPNTRIKRNQNLNDHFGYGRNPYELGANSVSNLNTARRNVGGRHSMRGTESTYLSWRPRRCQTSAECYGDAKSLDNLQVERVTQVACSPSARKSVCSFGQVTSPRNSATLFTKYRSPKSPPLMFIP